MKNTFYLWFGEFESLQVDFWSNHRMTLNDRNNAPGMISTHHNGASVSVERNDGKAVYMIGGDIGSRFENVDIEDRGFS